MGAAMSGLLVVMAIGSFGLYKAMAGAGPVDARGSRGEDANGDGAQVRGSGSTPRPRPATSRTTRRTQRYELPDEQAEALANEDSPAYVLGGFQMIVSTLRAEPKITEAFRTGDGRRLARARPGRVRGRRALLPSRLHRQPGAAWIPALDGVEAKLEAGARVADVGCGHGASTIIMAKAYPNSTFVGFDYHGPSIDAARAARRRGRRGRQLHVRGRRGQGLPRHDYDLVAHLRLPARHGRSGRRRRARLQSLDRTARG